MIGRIREKGLQTAVYLPSPLSVHSWVIPLHTLCQCDRLLLAPAELCLCPVCPLPPP